MYDPTLISVDQRERGGNSRRVGKWVATVLCLGVLLAAGAAPRFSAAQTTMQLMRWREFSYAKETKSTSGRSTILDAVNRSGFVVIGDGQFARLSSWVVHTTSPDGNEYYQGFVMYDFSDGSSILAKVDASGPPRPLPGVAGEKAKQTGTITFIAGTKRFDGITGRGTITSWMPAQWDLYAEIDATYSVPGSRRSDRSR
jgi:hypothetical protein